MESFPHLPQAPIAEAILDVHVRMRPGFDVATFARAKERLADAFPSMEERRRFAASMEVQVSGNATASSEDLGSDGYMFVSADRLDVAQFRVDGFSLNRLRPYQRWDEWFPKFSSAWQVYCEIAEPVEVLRLGARCINHIPLRPDLPKLEDYLAEPPRIPPGLPAGLTGFVTHLALADAKEPSLRLTLVESWQMSPTGPLLLLDIDAWHVGPFQTDSILPRFDDLHEMRNRAFFRTLNQKLVTTFR